MHLFSCSCSGLPHLQWQHVCISPHVYPACMTRLAAAVSCTVRAARKSKKQGFRGQQQAQAAALQRLLASLSSQQHLLYRTCCLHTCTAVLVIHMYRYSCTARPLLLRAHACCCVHGCRSVGGPIHVTVCSAASSSQQQRGTGSSQQQPAASSSSQPAARRPSIGVGPTQPATDTAQ